MFMTSVFSGAGLNGTDAEQERDPPAAPTPVSFPERRAYTARTWNEASPPPRLQPLFARVAKPADISARHIDALNIEAVEACPPEELLPLASDGSSYLPALTPNQAIDPAASYAHVIKLDATNARRRQEWHEKLAELRLENDSAFRVINRTTQPGVKPPRLAYLRKFWEGLESLAQYWDTSLDHYYERLPPNPDLHSEKDAKRQRLDSHASQPSILTLQTASAAHTTAHTISKQNASSTQPEGDHARENASPDNTASQVNGADKDNDPSSTSSSATPEPRLCPRYKGRRMASGREMPDHFRAEAVKAFVEAVVWSFQASIAAPRQLPIVQINKLNLPVRQSAAAYRVPTERTKQRQGWLEGPILCVQVRSETEFDDSSLSVQQREAKSRLDTMREIGGLLQLAQERQRQGKVEYRPGEGKWYTMKPRWGGGPGGEVENPEPPSEVKDVLGMAEEMVSASRDRTKRPKRKTPAMLWKELKPGSKLWDAKTEYQAIGKEPSSDYDEVFMVSSLNHHVSILKLTVHWAYVEYTKTEKIPQPVPEDENWCRPRLQRTKWYDLLDIPQRVEAFRALWGIMSYLMREVNEPAKPGAEESPASSRDTNMQDSGPSGRRNS
ncbi:hypothetical protein AC579_8148 [Pseudocercospora musae]|uniref:Uncharacterized protein n=1 Tax=Pseudocercospora musae TaxID=113226 RepID=A0A139IV06_9PEZI|nr:hypothetical protein AC579_8148 [Pseudocercospora musae]